MHLVHNLGNRLLVGLSDSEPSEILSVVNIYKSVDINILDVLESTKHNLAMIVLSICERVSDSFQCDASVCNLDTLFFFLFDEFVDLISGFLPLREAPQS